MKRIAGVFRFLGRPLLSRKVRVALATVVAAYAAQAGLDFSEEVLVTIMSCGVALILAIAHEDNGRPLPTDLRDDIARSRPEN